eukprot:TRINITY_DN55115_c0_g1_i1.p1 TRINITY_DN55115_c0_g1~~TRINITY_DN55115_c0_g1_i1.p1  ORF type:complete len:1020 (+),score=157.56 TRINITY_DN55115_c0_g1_i1:329-3061(+)
MSPSRRLRGQTSIRRPSQYHASSPHSSRRQLTSELLAVASPDSPTGSSLQRQPSSRVGLTSPMQVPARQNTLDASAIGLNDDGLQRILSPVSTSTAAPGSTKTWRQKALEHATKVAAAGQLARVTLRLKEQESEVAVARLEAAMSDEELAAKRRRQEIMRKGVRILRAAIRAELFSKNVRRDARKGSGSGTKIKMVWFNDKSSQDVDDDGDGSLAAAWSVIEQGNRDGQRGMMLPTAADLRDLPPSLFRTFSGLAMEALRKYAYPRILLWLRKRERNRNAERHRPGCPVLTVEILRRQAIFKDCPHYVLEELPGAMVYTGFETGELIIHEGENAGSGIYFLMTGSVDIIKKINAKCKSIGPKNTKVLVHLSPIMCVGEFSFLTEEPRMASIRASTHCDCWVLRKEDWAKFVERLAPELFSSVVDLAFAKRKQNMHMSYPLTEKDLRRSPIFRPCPNEMLAETLRRLTPAALPKSFTLAKGDGPADRILFLQNGKVGLMRPVDRVLAGGKRRKSVTHVGTVMAPCVIADTAVLHGVPLHDTYTTLSTCDVWSLSKDDFDQVLRTFPGVEAEMMAEARRQRQGQLSTQQNLFKEHIAEIPLLRGNISRQELREVVASFIAKVYKPMSFITSTAHFADRVVVLYKGRVRVGEPSFRRHTWYRGEAVGYTAVIPHRWAMLAMACEVVECLEVPIETYDAFLRKVGIRKMVVESIKRLMFPNAFPQEEVLAVQEQVAHLRTPPLYPISWSPQVSLCEAGYSGQSYGQLLSPRGPEAFSFPSPRRQQRKRNNPGERTRRAASSLPQLQATGHGAASPREPASDVKQAPLKMPDVHGAETSPPVLIAGAKRHRGWARTSPYLWRRQRSTGAYPEPYAGHGHETRALVASLRQTGKGRLSGRIPLPKQPNPPTLLPPL